MSNQDTTTGGPPKDTGWDAAWSGARERLRKELGDATFNAWIGPLRLVSADRDNIQIGAAKPFARNWVANHYVTRIDRALRAEGKAPDSLSIVLCTSVPPPNTGAVTSGTPVELPPSAYPASALMRNGEKPAAEPRNLWNRPLHPSQTFGSFVAGSENEFGYRAAESFADGSTESGLLYIHGGFGYGKTHLLNATALEARKRGKRALFLGAEDFMRQFLGALHRRDTLSFKDELRAADMLLIDDLQHICRSHTTVSEFLHTVNAFADSRRKLIVAADRAPAALETLSADVRSRLTGGLTIGLDKPGRDTRLAILKSRANEFTRARPHAVLPEEVLERIADMPDASPRDLLGVFTKLATYADLTKKPVTLDVAEEAVGQRSAPGRKISIEDIQRKTAEFYKLDIRDFQSPQRTRRVARPRQVAMFLARELTMRSLPEIGRRFGGRDHTTVLHACRRIAELCEEDRDFKDEVGFLRDMLTRRGL
ncbi:MAG: chromosomal replication initiator protein DnaA [bacterium]